jgi:hypothetical protein
MCDLCVIAVTLRNLCVSRQVYGKPVIAVLHVVYDLPGLCDVWVQKSGVYGVLRLAPPTRNRYSIAREEPALCGLFSCPQAPAARGLRE